MSFATVDAILQQIDALNFSERAEFEDRLAKRCEAEWRREAELARDEARARGLTQTQIDAAVERLRYGP